MDIKKPTTVRELEVLIYGLIESYEQNVGHIDTDKNLGVFVELSGEVFVITFGYIVENIPQPFFEDPTKNDYEPKSDKCVTLWHMNDSLYSLVKDIERDLQQIDSLKIRTEEE